MKQVNNTKSKILLVDDEISSLKVLSAVLKQNNNYDICTARTAEEGLDKAVKHDFDLIITDFKLPGINGIEFLDALKEKEYKAPVVMLTAYGTIEKAVDAMKHGAFNYLTKPINTDELLAVVTEAIEKRRLCLENISLKTQLKERYSFKNIIGKSHVMQDILSLVETISKSGANVLIMGESGTGKELIARAIYLGSPRANKPFIPIDCAALPEQLLESELFGYEKGSFTSAYERRIGLVEIANNGTLFLDEIGELSLSTQKKLLRFIQEREFLRIGGKDRIKVDLRIIAATNKKLDKEVKSGNFREDLFYRLNVVTINIPPLRDRKEDIPLLAKFFLNRFNEANKKAILSLDSEVMRAFMEYDWPGNIRELANVIERVVILCPLDYITVKYLPSSIRELTSEKSLTAIEGSLFETEKRLLLNALTKTQWNQTKAAEILGISRKQLRTKMKHHGLLPE